MAKNIYIKLREKAESRESDLNTKFTRLLEEEKIVSEKLESKQKELDESNSSRVNLEHQNETLQNKLATLQS